MGATSSDTGFESLLQHVKEQRGFDFTGYKRASLERRVQRRMSALGIDSYDDYLDHLLVHPDEFTGLFNTILINVTSFFRDIEAWDYLREHVVPDLLARRESQPLRLWSAGCAAGQEAYSLATVLAEALGVDQFRERVKIYATDVDEEALGQARHANYSAQEAEGLPTELRTKYFEQVGDRYVFRKELRRAVIFGRNDLVQDAPISQVDVLACRNTLMYFNAETQARILRRLHFALKPDGVLFLGKAEMLLGHSGYFRPLDVKRRFFSKITTRVHQGALAGATPATLADPAAQDLNRLRHAAFLSSASAQVVLDAERRLTLANHRAMHLFGLTPRDIGRPVQDLELSYRPLELRSHLDQAAEEHRPFWVRDVEWHRGAETVTFDVNVLPLADEGGGDLGLSVIFTDVSQYRQLQRDLQVANRQLETAYEELQSTNEELETMNEELQSTNEELQTLNDELRERTHQVDEANAFLQSILEGLDHAVAVVDSDYRVQLWNTGAERLTGLRAFEAEGLRFLDLDLDLPVDEVHGALRAVVVQGEERASLDVEVTNRFGRRSTRTVVVSGLRRGRADVRGAVVTFADAPAADAADS